MIKVHFASMVGKFDKNRYQKYKEQILPKWEQENVISAQIEDENKSGCWNTCKRAWLHLAEDKEHFSHGMVLQDDFIPCLNFLDQNNL